MPMAVLGNFLIYCVVNAFTPVSYTHLLVLSAVVLLGLTLDRLEPC